MSLVTQPKRLPALFSIALLITLLGACGEQPTGEPASTEAGTTAEITNEFGVDTSAPGWRLSLDAPEPMAFAPGDEYLWELETNVGTMRFRLFTDTAPQHATSTIYLTELGFYDGLAFHRVIPGFMAQGGDPRGDGTGNPGYRYYGEFEGNRSHDRPGILSMANAGPGTDGSQFFITFVPTPFLDGKHTIFGEIVAGDAVLAELEARGSRSGATIEPLLIEKASIIRP